jgi:predicted dithiol-disulfide oxidoreductase (DUF899 family)
VAENVGPGWEMGRGFPWASSLGSDFNFDFGVGYTDEQIASGLAKHTMHLVWDHSDSPAEPFRKSEERPPKDLPGLSAFALDNGVVYHTYSANARGTDVLWGMYQWPTVPRTDATRRARGSDFATSTTTARRSARSARPPRRACA